MKPRGNVIKFSFVNLQSLSFLLNDFSDKSKGPSGNTSSSFYLWSKRIGGEGVETSENLILEEKPEEKGGGRVQKPKT